MMATHAQDQNTHARIATAALFFTSIWTLFLLRKVKKKQSEKKTLLTKHKVVAIILFSVPALNHGDSVETIFG